MISKIKHAVRAHQADKGCCINRSSHHGLITLLTISYSAFKIAIPWEIRLKVTLQITAYSSDTVLFWTVILIVDVTVTKKNSVKEYHLIGQIFRIHNKKLRADSTGSLKTEKCMTY